MQILNIAGYKFISLNDIPSLQVFFHDLCESLSIKGTILLSEEGINMNLAGIPADIQSFQTLLKQDSRFCDITFHESYSADLPFNCLKVKFKKEIITLHQPTVDPVAKRAASLSPEEFKQWMDEKRDFTLLDTRNDYEVRFGTFDGAINLQIDDFGQFPAAIDPIEPNRPVVMFCTGGIRCEKAALYMQNQGFSSVYQLDGGILGYFKKVGGAHYQGECFVFDERVSVDDNLQCTGTVQCLVCQGPVTKNQQSSPDYVRGVSCPACLEVY